MNDFFKWKMPRWRRCFLWVLYILFIGPYSTALLPCGGAKEQVWLDKVIARVEEMYNESNDPKVRRVLAYTAHRYRKIGPFSVQIRSCSWWCAGINVPYCPGVTLDPEMLNEDIDFGVWLLTHEAQHDFFPYLGHEHFVEVF